MDVLVSTWMGDPICLTWQRTKSLGYNMFIEITVFNANSLDP